MSEDVDITDLIKVEPSAAKLPDEFIVFVARLLVERVLKKQECPVAQNTEKPISDKSA